MRSLRVMLAGLMVLALLWGLGAAAAAQCETKPVLSADFVYSTGTFQQVGMEEGEYTETGAIEGSRERGGSVTIRIESDDPRISGDLVIDPFDADEGFGVETSGIFWGTGQLLTDEGSWQGPVEGISHERGMTSVGWLTGAGGYEGLTWFYRATAPFGDEEKYDGPFAESLVYRGDPPPDGASFTVATGDVVMEAEFVGPIEYAPAPSIDPSLVPDADGFVFEEVTPGVRRLVTDGAGHFPSARYICEARDMDELAVDAEGRVLVWSTTHGIDNELGGDSQLWSLGEEGVLSQSKAPVQPLGPDSGQVAPDGSSWSLEWEYGSGVIRSDGETAERFLADHFPGSLAIAPDGRVWVAEGHDSGEAGGIYVIEPDAVSEPVDVAAMAVMETIPGPTSDSTPIPVSSVTLVGEPFFDRATVEADIRRCSGLVVDADTVVDGEFLPESQCWDEGAVWWEDAAWGDEPDATRDRWIELELGGVYRLDGVIVQADDNDAYLLSYRDPDSGAWSPLWRVPPAYSFGMTTRPAPFDRALMHVLAGTTTDAVRFEADSGDGMYSVSEIRLFGEPVADPT